MLKTIIKIVTLVGFILFLGNVNAQEVAQDTIKGRMLHGTIDENGDTIPRVYLGQQYVWARRTFPNKKEEKKYTRLMKNVMVVYPYAKMANELLAKYEAEFDTITDRKIRKSYYKKVEDELWAKYGDDLKNMTVSQGRILIKLVDRETDRTSYELVKEMRSGFTAFVFQGMARMFGHNLKSEYNAQDEDKYIEEIIIAIESNQI
ncbi:MAG: hypothetical protein CL840_12970 [Crocinitomicaceae bacterium]|nr:hypothetical protein [Crocinitomicaceae bacterium]|tara:strand:- start:8610 stop:9221 length:612 start_codon:yes stop_codon:yes gene_type:complete